MFSATIKTVAGTRLHGEPRLRARAVVGLFERVKRRLPALTFCPRPRRCGKAAPIPIA